MLFRSAAWPANLQDKPEPPCFPGILVCSPASPGTYRYLLSAITFSLRICLLVDISARPRSNIVDRNLALVSNVQSLSIHGGPRGNHSPLLGSDAGSIVSGYLNYSLLHKSLLSHLLRFSHNTPSRISILLFVLVSHSVSVRTLHSRISCGAF